MYGKCLVAPQEVLTRTRLLTRKKRLSNACLTSREDSHFHYRGLGSNTGEVLYKWLRYWHIAYLQTFKCKIINFLLSQGVVLPDFC